MKRILISLSIIGVVSAFAIGGTIAFFSDTETSTGNTFTAGTLDLGSLGNISWEFPFLDMKPGDSTGEQMLLLQMASGSNSPNHLEIDVDTHSFVDGIIESGGSNTADDFKKQIKVEILKYQDSGPAQNLLSLVNDDADWNLGFISLYDVEAYGVFDDLPTLKEFGLFTVQLSLPTDLPDANDDKYQGDSIKINFEFGTVQVAGQDVLTD